MDHIIPDFGVSSEHVEYVHCTLAREGLYWVGHPRGPRDFLVGEDVQPNTSRLEAVCSIIKEESLTTFVVELA